VVFFDSSRNYFTQVPDFIWVRMPVWFLVAVGISWYSWAHPPLGFVRRICPVNVANRKMKLAA
jgi:hypothetical protein